jgi:hypothetical protein
VIGPSAAPKVHIDKLCEVGERRHLRFEQRVVGARSAVDENNRRAFDHDWALRDELQSLDVDKETKAPDIDSHGRNLILAGRHEESAPDLPVRRDRHGPEWSENLVPEPDTAQRVSPKKRYTTRGEVYRDLGPDYYDNRIDKDRRTPNLVPQAQRSRPPGHSHPSPTTTLRPAS